MGPARIVLLSLAAITGACRWDFDRGSAETDDGPPLVELDGNELDASDDNPLADAPAGPADADGDAAVDAPTQTSMTCTSSSTCACTTGEICQFSCPAGGCSVSCQSGSTCELTCANDCVIECEDGAYCSVQCQIPLSCSAGSNCTHFGGCFVGCGVATCGADPCCAGV